MQFLKRGVIYDNSKGKIFSLVIYRIASWIHYIFCHICTYDIFVTVSENKIYPHINLLTARLITFQFIIFLIIIVFSHLLL